MLPLTKIENTKNQGTNSIHSVGSSISLVESNSDSSSSSNSFGKKSRQFIKIFQDFGECCNSDEMIENFIDSM